ncbi:MAG: hypothetical protein JSV25_13860 [Spirochaetota bacterium]|nr:MAG: hypothetical protein JSV25_13860 [Spirochaetota bacterium]
MKKLIIAGLLIFFVSPKLFAYTIKKNVPDIELEGFENSIPSNIMMVGYPSGIPEAYLQRTDAEGEYVRGEFGLSFEYRLGTKPVPILFHHVLLKDFQSIDFWIKSKRKTKWVLTFTDLDGAEFSTLVDITPGQWKHVSLNPGDFTCNEDSPVKKERVDVSGLGYGYASFDLFAIFGTTGQNSVWIDDVKIVRRAIDIITGDYVLNNKNEEFIRNTRIKGNLILTNGSVLTVNADKFQIDGNIIVKNAALILNQGMWIFHQDYRYHHHIWVQKRGRVEMNGGRLFMYQPYSAGVSENAALTLRDVEVIGGLFTLGLQKGGSLALERCKNFGEVIIEEGTDISVSGCESILLWLNCGKGLKAQVSLPDNVMNGRWKAPSSLKRDVIVENSRDVMWGLIALNGCNITISRSSLRAVGILYTGRAKAVVRDMKNDVHYANFSYNSPFHDLRFIETKVRTWNFYTGGNAELEIRDCVYGESISFGNSQINVFDSICDGSGGYIGARENSATNFYGGEISCDVLTHDRAQFLIQDCGQVGGRVEAAGESKITVVNTPLLGKVREIEEGEVTVKN